MDVRPPVLLRAAPEQDRRAYTIHGGQVLWAKMSELPAIDLLEGMHARATCDEGGNKRRRAGGRE